jgi:hypothetical protein
MRGNRCVGRLFMIAAMFVACSRVNWGAEMNIVSPSEAADVEGDDSLHAGPRGHLQMLFPAEDFMSLPDTHHTITSFAWRQDESTELTEPITAEGQRIIMSTTFADELVPTFADNLGDDETLVFEGGYVWQTDDTGPGPRAFDFVFSLDTPFNYDPSGGRNLILDFIPTLAADHVDDWFVDRQTTDRTTWQAQRDPFAPVSIASPQTLMVTQFTFVPEPSTFASAALGLLCLVGWVGWRRRRQPT